MSDMSPITEGATPVDIEDDGFVTFTDETPPAKPAANAKRAQEPARQAQTPAEQQINAWASEKDRQESDMLRIEAEIISVEENAIEAERQINAEHDADVQKLIEKRDRMLERKRSDRDDELAELRADKRSRGIILAGLSAGIEKAIQTANGGEA